MEGVVTRITLLLLPPVAGDKVLQLIWSGRLLPQHEWQSKSYEWLKYSKVVPNLYSSSIQVQFYNKIWATLLRPAISQSSPWDHSLCVRRRCFVNQATSFRLVCLHLESSVKHQWNGYLQQEKMAKWKSGGVFRLHHISVLEIVKAACARKKQPRNCVNQTPGYINISHTVDTSAVHRQLTPWFGEPLKNSRWSNRISPNKDCQSKTVKA